MISKFVYTTSKKRMLAQIIFLQARCCAQCFVFIALMDAFVIFKTKNNRKASLQSIRHHKTFKRFTCENACPTVMCRRHFFFSYVCLTHQLHTTHSKEYLLAVPLKSTILLPKPCHTYCKSSPTWSVYKGTGYKGRQRYYHKTNIVALLVGKKGCLGDEMM